MIKSCMKQDSYVYKQLNENESICTPESITPKVVSFANLDDPSVYEYESGSFVVLTSSASTPTFENMETLSSDDDA